MAKLNKECILCKTKYEFCNRCEEYDHLPRWKAIYCSDNCRKIFMTATDYGYKHITKEEAKKILDNCDLSMKDTYHPSTKNIIDEIYIEEYHQETTDKILNNNTEEDIIVLNKDNTEETGEKLKMESVQVETEVKNYKKYKKNYK